MSRSSILRRKKGAPILEDDATVCPARRQQRSAPEKVSRHARSAMKFIEASVCELARQSGYTIHIDGDKAALADRKVTFQTGEIHSTVPAEWVLPFAHQRYDDLSVLGKGDSDD